MLELLPGWCRWLLGGPLEYSVRNSINERQIFISELSGCNQEWPLLCVLARPSAPHLVVSAVSWLWTQTWELSSVLSPAQLNKLDILTTLFVIVM